MNTFMYLQSLIYMNPVFYIFSTYLDYCCTNDLNRLKKKKKTKVVL